jgi:hypothetical protein
MRQLNTREKSLLGLLAVAGIAGWFGMRGGGIGFGGELGGPEPLGPISGEPPLVRVDLLEQDPIPFDPSGRNLFAYYTPPAPKQPRARPQRPPAPPPPPPPPKRETAPKRQTTQAPQPPTPDFSYVGYLGPKENRIAVFTAGEEMLVARVGEVVEEQFELKEFRYETVIFGFTDPQFHDRTTELKLHTSEE